MALRPSLPKLRAVLLGRLSETDPAAIERLLGAVSTAIESVLYHAPGDPLPRYRFAFSDAGELLMVPLEEPAEELAADA